MALYIGATKYKLNIDGNSCEIDIRTPIPVVSGVGLLSSDGCFFVDKNWTYMTASEYIVALSLDDSILYDIEDNYLIMKKG